MKTPRTALMWRGDGQLKIMSNSSMTLYTGVTNDIRKRSDAHKDGTGSQFTSRYHFDRLVYYETFESAEGAIAREKQIKAWSRRKKIALIKTMNPEWRDLSADFEVFVT